MAGCEWQHQTANQPVGNIEIAEGKGKSVDQSELGVATCDIRHRRGSQLFVFRGHIVGESCRYEVLEHHLNRSHRN